MATPGAHRILLFTAILFVVASTSQASGASQPVRRIRLLAPCASMLIADAAARSATIRSLIERIDRSDLIVFVRCVAFMQPAVAGRLMFLGAAAGHRFLLIEIRIPAVWHTQAGVVGHELQHAVEVAGAPNIRSQADMAAHYARTGVPVSAKPAAFETEAARRTGLQVLRELPVVPDTESARMRASRGDLGSQR
jgi:hypothetical protein